VSSTQPSANVMSLLEIFKMFLYKEKYLYTNLNKLKKEDKLYLGFCWIPSEDRAKILTEIEGIKEKNRNIEIPTLKVISEHDHGLKPPSLFRLNEFTSVFSEIVFTYGIPNYKEVNPTVFTIVTFPFAFGVMFGDIGHGLVLFSVGGLLCLLCSLIRSKTSAMEGILGMRYILLMMGIFATFCGLIYNDFMAIPLWLFGSCYSFKEEPNAAAKEGYVLRLESVKNDCTYPIGIDPGYYMGTNELTF